jgi:hypothetical protein
MFSWFGSRRRPRTNSAQRAADAIEDAAFALRYPDYEADRRRGRVRSQSPRSDNRNARTAMRDAAWAAEQAARPSLARRASQGALNLAQGASRGALNLAQGASNLAVRASRGALNFVRRPARAAAAADAAAADAAAARRAAAADAAARRAAAAPADAAADDRELECSICYSNAIAGQAADPDEEAVLVDCPVSHRFHRGCIVPWIDKHKGHATCPNCRGNITKVTAAKKGGGYRSRGRRTRSKSKSRRYPRKPHKTRKV